MDTSSSALGKRVRSALEPSNIDNPTPRLEGNRSRGDAPATKLAACLAVVYAHAVWWSPDLKPEIEAGQSLVAESVVGAISAWVADKCNRILGQELTLEEDAAHADSVQAGKLQ